MLATILCVEASSGLCSVALDIEGAVIQRQVAAVRAHNEQLLEMVKDVVDEAGVALANVDLFGFGQGPGSFTGVRLAAAVAQGYALAGSRALVGVCSMRALAARVATVAESTARVDVALDARMGQVYVASYGSRDGRAMTVGAMQELMEPRLGTTQDALTWLTEIPSGSGVRVRAGHGWQLGDLQDAPPGAAREPLLADLEARAVDVLAVLRADLATGRAVVTERVTLPWLDGGRRWRRHSGASR